MGGGCTCDVVNRKRPQILGSSEVIKTMTFTVDRTVIPGLDLDSAVSTHVSVTKGQPMCTRLSPPFSTAALFTPT